MLLTGSHMFKPDPSGKKLGPLWFTPGISYFNASTLLYGSFSTLAALTFMNFVQPYILTEILHIPKGQQGSVVGNLAAVQEVVVILVMGWVGAMSDNVGRRIIFVVGFLIIGFGYLIYPLADSVTQLVIFRVIFAVGAATVPVMLSACLVDYIQEISRGKWIGTASIFNGLGVLTMALVLSQSPKWFVEWGADAASAGRYAFWLAAALCFVSAVILHFGLKGKSGDIKRERFNVALQLRNGMAAARNPRIALSFSAAFIGRGDLVVIGTFFSLWIVQTGDDMGLSTGQSLGKAGILFGLIQLSALSWAFFMGVIADRINRVSALAFALIIASIGYLLMGGVDDPFGQSIIPVCIFLGIGETSVVITGGALLGQEAPVKIRGAVVGVFALTGAVGILFATAVGGQVFDLISRTAPFTMMGLLNGILALVAIFVRIKAGQPQAAVDPA